VKCPKCKSKSEVLETTQKDGATRRRRRCVSPTCEFRFSTTETTSDTHSPRPSPNAAELVAKLIAPEFKGSGKFDPEALAAAIAVDQRKLAIRRAERAKSYRERAAWYDTGFDPAPESLNERDVRREIDGY
jgi:hypothetical protein